MKYWKVVSKMKNEFNISDLIKELIILFISVIIAACMTIIVFDLKTNFKENGYHYDINNDGQVNAKDLLLLRKYLEKQKRKRK